MIINRFGLFSIPTPFYNLDGGGGSGGDPSGGSGTSGTSGTGGDPGAGAPPAEPSVIDVDDNALIRVKGSDKPVKFGEHVRGFQKQHTLAAQKAAQLQRELEKERQLRTRYEQERQSAQNRGQEDDIYSQLGQLPYLTGQHAVDVVRGIAEQIKQRDSVLLGALKQMQQMQQVVKELHGNHINSSFQSKVAQVVADAGYDPGWNDWAQKLYLAYEGDDLDEEFPRIFAEEAAKVEKLFEARRQSKISAAKQTRFVPGKGGDAKPSKPLEIKPDTDPKALADQLFGLFAESET